MSGSGDYVLSIGGNTPVAPAFQVAAINPANGANLLTAPTTITVDFNDAMYSPSVDASDLLVDGLAIATGVTQIDGDTLEFTIPAGLASGTHTLAFAAGSILDVQQTPLNAFSSSFSLDATAPRVIATSIAPGGTVTASTISYQVTFSEPMKVSNLSADDFNLHGNIQGVNYTPLSFSYNPAGTVVRLNYSNLPEDNYTMTLFSGVAGGSNFTDIAGHALDGEFSGVFPSGDGNDGGNFAASFSRDIVTAAFPVPLSPAWPLGSLAYYSPTQASGLINSSGDSDTFTISVDPGQKITAMVWLGWPYGLQPTLQLVDPNNVVIATATAAGPGQNALMQSIPTTVATTGTYKLIVSGASATTGNYFVNVLLNASQEEEGFLAGTTNDSLATAQNIDGNLLSLGGTASRAAVLGQTLPGAAADYYSFTVAAGDIVTLANNPGARRACGAPRQQRNADRDGDRRPFQRGTDHQQYQSGHGRHVLRPSYWAHPVLHAAADAERRIRHRKQRGVRSGAEHRRHARCLGTDWRVGRF